MRPISRTSHFLVPNGWQGEDGAGICDSEDLTHLWRGRAEAVGDGWRVVIDRHAVVDLQAWADLAEIGGNRFTHTGRLERVDGTTFTAEQAFEALDRVRMALNLAFGRRTTCALPVGWRAGKAVWARWRSAPVDAYSSQSHWLDSHNAYRQVGDVIAKVLNFTADEANREALRAALSYYVASNDVDVELSVSIPVSGLQLLSYYRFVTELKQYSQSKWDDLTTEAQIRLLIEHLKVDTSVPTHFQHLAKLQAELAITGPKRDVLGLIIKMRNVVTHPEKDQPARFSPYQWAEGGMHARYWLCLALLNRVSYEGEVAAILGDRPRWTGQLRHVPWVP